VIRRFQVFLLILLWAVSGIAVAQTMNPPVSSDDPARLIDQLGSAVPMVQQTLAKNKLEKLGVKVLPVLHEALLNDKRIYVRVQCAQILGRIGDASSVPVLEEAFGQKYMTVKQSVTRGLGAIASKESRAALARLSKQTTDSALKELIAREISTKRKN
jgi:HEAT repeat protein